MYARAIPAPAVPPSTPNPEGAFKPVQVKTIAHTLIDWDALNDVAAGTEYGRVAESEYNVTDADHLAEFAGRACYKAFGRLRPETATTAGYLANIIDQGHFSVLEHASVTFHVEGASRSMLLELERHRFLSFSVESQRYVDQAKSHPTAAIPPALRDTVVGDVLSDVYRAALFDYGVVVDFLTIAGGLGIKQAREAARAFLPNATPVDFVVTGNLRCWRDVLGKRYNAAADAEIREFAGLILTELREIAPASFADFPAVPFGAEV